MRIIFHALFTSPGYEKLKNECWLVKNTEEKKSKRPLLVNCLYSDTEVPECMNPSARMQEVHLSNCFNRPHIIITRNFINTVDDSGSLSSV